MSPFKKLIDTASSQREAWEKAVKYGKSLRDLHLVDRFYMTVEKVHRTLYNIFVNEEDDNGGKKK